MRKPKGFSLIELLIVVAIILIIAAIAIPNLLRARMAANESSAVQSMRTIFTAEMAYNAAGWTNGGATIGFSAQLPDLGGAGAACSAPTFTAACQLDDFIANATSTASSKSGYYFTYSPVAGGTTNFGFTLNGDPVVRGQTGQRSFFADQTGIIRANSTGAAGSGDNPI
jgi:prepilin-type N-terminal cleavage/methylation domain-containing protein